MLTFSSMAVVPRLMVAVALGCAPTLDRLDFSEEELVAIEVRRRIRHQPLAGRSHHGWPPNCGINTSAQMGLRSACIPARSRRERSPANAAFRLS
jgi:hypothetical protein